MSNHFVPYLKLEGRIINGIQFNFPTDKRHSNQAVIWNVTCHCGNTFEYSASLIKSGKKISCGCKYQQASKSEEELLLKYVWSRYVASATKKKLEFNLSENNIKNIILSKQCFYDNNNGLIHQKNIFKQKQIKRLVTLEWFGIDRIDNNKGYIIENCVPCCRECNFLKRDYNMGDLKRLQSILEKLQVAGKTNA